MSTDAGHLHARIFGDFVNASETVSSDDLPRIPPLRYGIGLHYTLASMEATIEATLNEQQNDIAPGELRTDSYTLLSGELSYAFDSPNLFAFVRGKNLLDEDARQHTSPLKDSVPLPGRSLQVGLRYDF
jgi:iron complex outermembrane receptor protein